MKQRDQIEAKNPNWRGGRSFHSKGYVYMYCPDHPKASNGYVFEHRLVMEAHLDRFLRDDEIVHHKNGRRGDNRVENLEILSHLEHAERRAPEFSPEKMKLLTEFIGKININELASTLKIGRRRLKRIIQEHFPEYVPFNPKAPRWDYDVAVELYNKGYAASEIAKVVGVSAISVRNALIKRGVFTADRKWGMQVVDTKKISRLA